MSLTAGITKSCVSRSGGLLEIHLANVEDVDTFTLTSGVYTAVTMNASAVFFKFEFEQDTAEYRENVTMENGSIAATHEVEMFIGGLTATNRDRLQEIADQSVCGMIGIVKDANGVFWVVGYSETALKERPLRLLTDASATGKAFTDLVGSTVTLQSVDGDKALTFTGTVPN